MYRAGVFFLFGRKSKVRPVEGGRKEKRACPECGQTALFVEAEKKSDYSAYLVLDLFSSTDRVFVCSACGEWMDLEDTEAPALSAEERARLLREKAAELDRALKARERERKKQERDVERELAALKKQLGKK